MKKCWIWYGSTGSDLFGRMEGANRRGRHHREWLDDITDWGKASLQEMRKAERAGRVWWRWRQIRALRYGAWWWWWRDLSYPPINAIWRLFLKKSLSRYCGIAQYGNSSEVCMIWRAFRASTASKCSLKHMQYMHLLINLSAAKEANQLLTFWFTLKRPVTHQSRASSKEKTVKHTYWINSFWIFL